MLGIVGSVSKADGWFLDSSSLRRTVSLSLSEPFEKSGERRAPLVGRCRSSGVPGPGGMFQDGGDGGQRRSKKYPTYPSPKMMITLFKHVQKGNMIDCGTTMRLDFSRIRVFVRHSRRVCFTDWAMSNHLPYMRLPYCPYCICLRHTTTCLYVSVYAMSPH